MTHCHRIPGAHPYTSILTGIGAAPGVQTGGVTKVNGPQFHGPYQGMGAGTQGYHGVVYPASMMVGVAVVPLTPPMLTLPVMFGLYP